MRKLSSEVFGGDERKKERVTLELHGRYFGDGVSAQRIHQIESQKYISPRTLHRYRAALTAAIASRKLFRLVGRG